MVNELIYHDNRSCRYFEINIIKFNRILKKYGITDTKILMRDEALQKFKEKKDKEGRNLIDTIIPWSSYYENEKNSPVKEVRKVLGFSSLYVEYARGKYDKPLNDKIIVYYRLAKDGYLPEK